MFSSSFEILFIAVIAVIFIFRVLHETLSSRRRTAERTSRVAQFSCAVGDTFELNGVVFTISALTATGVEVSWADEVSELSHDELYDLLRRHGLTLRHSADNKGVTPTTTPTTAAAVEEDDPFAPMPEFPFDPMADYSPATMPSRPSVAPVPPKTAVTPTTTTAATAIDAVGADEGVRALPDAPDEVLSSDVPQSLSPLEKAIVWSEVFGRKF